MTRSILITTDRTFPSWRTLPEKMHEIESTLNTMKNADFAPFEVEYRNLKPEVLNGRITHAWMDTLSHPLLAQGYEFVILHMSLGQKSVLAIQSTLYGIHFVDLDDVSETYVMTDESDRRGRYNAFVQRVLHELRHAIKRGSGLPDDTHELHGKGEDIRLHFVDIDFALYQPRRARLKKQVSLLTTILNLFARMTTTPTIYQQAAKYLGRDASPADRAPDEVGCAESVSTIIRDVLPNFPIITGTYTLWQKLENDPRFVRTDAPAPGVIIVSPTGTVRSHIPGHAGIFAEGELIMSNSSFTGSWEKNYNLTTWRNRWGKAGYKMYYYKLIA